VTETGTAHAPPVIELVGLGKHYGDRVAVDGVTFSVPAGRIVGLVGPNGAGKTTTLRAIAGIHAPSAGTVRVAGHDVVREPVQAKRRLALVPDEPALFSSLTVWEHLEFTARIYGVRDWRGPGEALLAELELADRRGSLADELSRGMRQKVAVACALLHGPAALLFDEPLTGLDPLGIRRMRETIVARGRAGAAILLSSHLLHMVEEICTRVIIMDRGNKIADGTFEELRSRADLAEAGSNLEQIFLHVTGRNQPAGEP
jgi:ABC-2 type transport system ATP-binding protein